ncbi:MAG: hypothetical protein KC478_13460 [Bacteriovoracaceae bacterium]|nr:hypothetical protein [Bacteriovoracaceae bacterium]
MRVAIIALILFCSTCYGASDFKAHININGTKTFQVEPSKPLSIEFYFSDPKTQSVYKHFELTHGKLMHMVLIKKDLSVFKHILPYFDPSTGRFRATLNMPYSDPDNQQAINALSTPGMYMIMVSVKVKGLGPRMAHLSLNAIGESVQKPIELDPIDADMSVTKFFLRNETDELPFYKARLSHATKPSCMSNHVDFKIELFERDDSNSYVPLEGVQPWLGNFGHAVWVSETLMSAHKTYYAHLHSNSQKNDGYEHILRFEYFDKSHFLPGKQKIWIQFKHKDKLVALPFVFEYYPAPVTGDNC